MHVSVCRAVIVCAALTIGWPSIAAQSPRPSIRVKIINPGDEPDKGLKAATEAASQVTASVAAPVHKAESQSTPADTGKAIEVTTLPVASAQANENAPTGTLPETVPLPPAEPAPTWNAAGGSTLRSTMEAWAATANWSLRWEADDLNYPIDVGFQMEGDFTDVVSATFDLYKTARRPFKVALYAPQHLMVVTEKK